MPAPRFLLSLWAVGAAVVVLGPQLAFVATAREAWPFTCAPMFAAALDDAWEVHLVVEKAGGGEVPLDTIAIEIPEWRFTRLLYADTVVDGRVDENRAAAFWRTFVGHARSSKARKSHRLPADARAIRVELLDPRRRGEGVVDGAVVVVGAYEIAAQRWRAGGAR